MAKGPEAFRTISEAAGELGVPQHVLRFWETKFSFVRPMKRAGGRRFYRPHDIAVLASVRRLLHEQGYTIKGVQKLHRDKGLKEFALPDDKDDELEHPDHDQRPTGDVGRLEELRRVLEFAKFRLDAVLADV
ncbi:MAG TPA: MerR family transcriptional regulator [Caulobacteraceae bacterium]